MPLKIGYIDLDNLPKFNLPIAKTSTWASYHGHTFEPARRSARYDLLFVTCVFTWNSMKLRKIIEQYPDIPIAYGGTGFYPLTFYLPNEIDHMYPDYSLFPKAKFSYGWTTRGCSRRCNFCIVHDIHGDAHPVADIYEWYNSNYHDIRILDDNILMCRDHAIRIFKQVTKECLRMDMSQGMDIRLIDPEIAHYIKKMIWGRYIRFAWDFTEDEKPVRKGIETLRKARVDLTRTFWYCICKREDLTMHLRSWNNCYKYRLYTTFEDFLKNRGAESLLNHKSENFIDIFYRLKVIRSYGATVRVMLLGDHARETWEDNPLPVRKSEPKARYIVPSPVLQCLPPRFNSASAPLGDRLTY